ncbi:hypothetical protein [Gimesia aquarii]|uniref:Uncharacterized protein n=1 Tax=Gimesia aquarii TaxID=2527964 RepID=A0A517X2Y9_9PLAN|nr:hypothetical protein [Gimesia aquarii]QDU11852.1 hypothetical protein V202x_52770 [Gimesia aquarii]
MSECKDEVFAKWWPLTQSLTLVRAPCRRVARAMKAEAKRAHHSTGAVYEFGEDLRVQPPYCLDLQ